MRAGHVYRIVQTESSAAETGGGREEEVAKEQKEREAARSRSFLARSLALLVSLFCSRPVQAAASVTSHPSLLGCCFSALFFFSGRRDEGLVPLRAHPRPPSRGGIEGRTVPCSCMWW